MSLWSGSFSLSRLVMSLKRVQFGVLLALSQQGISIRGSTLPRDAIKRHLLKMLKGNSQFYDVVPSHVKDNPDSYLKIRMGLR